MFTFDEDIHQGYWNNEPIPNVTRIIKPLEDWDAVPQAIKGPAASKGDFRHRMIEAYLQGELNENALEQDDKDCLVQFRRFEQEEGFIPDDAIIEYRMCNKRGKKYCGKPDIIINCHFKHNKQGMVIELKFGTFDEWRHKYVFPLQLFGYKTLWLQNGGTPGDYLHYCLYLQPDDYKFLECENRQAGIMFNYLLKRWYQNRDFDKKINQWKNQKP